MRDGGPAFPGVGIPEDYPPSGMTLRDWFAGQALIRLSEDWGDDHTAFDVAQSCYQMADAMLDQREKR